MYKTVISGALGKQRFFVDRVVDGEWERTNNDIGVKFIEQTRRTL